MSENVFNKITLTLIAAILSLNAFIFAEEYKTYDINEIIVTDKFENENSPVFSKKEVERAKNVYLPDILKYEPEINVNRRAVTGDNADMLSIRGLSGSRILLNLNGRSLNAAGVVGGYYNDFSVIPIDIVDKIQIIKGGGDVKYGNNALGGVVNVITKKTAEKLDISFFSGFSAGSDIDYMFNNRLSISNKTGKLGYVITASHQKSDEYLWNNDFEAKNAGGRFYIDGPYNGNISLGVQYTNTERGFIRKNRKSDDPTNPLFYQRYNDDYPLAFGDTLNPYGGNISQPGPDSYWIKEKTLLDLSYSAAIKDWFSEFKIYKNLENRFEYNYSSHITSPTYPNPDGTLVFKRKVESDRSWGANLDISRDFDKQSLNFGGEYKYLGYGDINVYYVDMSYGCFGITCYGGPASQSADVYAGYLKYDYKVSEKLTARAGLRYDDYRVNEENNSGVKEFNENLLSYSAGIVYDISENQKTSLNLYSKYRTPTMPEVYWWSNNQLGYTGKLKSEKNNAFEVNYSIRLKKHIFELSAYNYDIDNYIMFRFNPKRGAYNIDNVNVKGASLSYKSKINSISPYVNISLQKTKKGNDFYDSQKLTDELDYSPKFKLNAGFDFKITEKININTNYRYSDVSKTIYSWKSGSTTYFKLINVKSYNVVDMEIKYNYNKNITASLYTENLFSEKYEEKFGYPMPQRIIGGSISMRF